MAINSSGVYVAGDITEPAICIQNLESAGFLRKYDFEGNPLWTTSIPIVGRDEVKVKAVVVNAFGVFVTGAESESGFDPAVVIAQLDFEGNWVTCHVLYSMDNSENMILPSASAAEENSLYLVGVPTREMTEERNAFLAKVSLDLSGP